MKLKLIFAVALSMPAVAFCQSSSGNGTPVVVVVGRPMTSTDSLMVKQLFFSALREKTIENYTLASDLFNRILQTDPMNDASMYELALIKKQQNNMAEAQSLLEKAVTVRSDNEWYWLALSECYEKNNDIPKLSYVFDELIKIRPDDADYYFDKANALFLEKKYDEALQIYGKVEQLTGLTDDLVAKRQKIYLAQGKVDKAAVELEQLITDNPGQVRYYLLLAEIYNSNGLNDKALKVLERAEKAKPSNGVVHLALADIYRDKKNYEGSFNQLKMAFNDPDIPIDQKLRIIMGYLPKFPDPNAKSSALELSRVLTVVHPGEARAYAIYGDMLMQNERYKDARPMYQKALSLNAQIYAVHEQLVRLDLGDSNYDAAIKDGDNALSMFPNQGWMNYLVGVAWVQKKNPTKALGYLKNATSLEVQDKDLLSQCYSAMGDCYHQLKDDKRSDEAYDKALTYNPDNAYTLNNYAYYLSVRGEQLGKAEQMSHHSNELQPNNPSFQDTYAWILFKEKKYAEAKVWIEKALVNDKDHSAVQSEHYGDIMFYLGDVNAAVQNWKKAKQYGGQSPVLERKINERKYIE